MALRRRSLAAASVIALSVGCGGKGVPASPSTSPTSVAPLMVSGFVRDRINDGPIDGSMITFRSTSLNIQASAIVASGSYSLPTPVPAGNYEVEIVGDAHVPHKEGNYFLTAARNDFTVIKWGSCRFGACYDTQFHEYMEWVARFKDSLTGPNPGRDGGKVTKWLTPPKEIWVIAESHSTEGSTYVYDSLPPPALAEFMSDLTEINSQSVPDMFCAATGPLPVVLHAPVSTYTTAGVITIRFTVEQSDAASYATRDDAITAASIILGSGHYKNPESWPRRRRQYSLAHELFHTAFAHHAFAESGSGARQDGLMNGPDIATRLSGEERLAACIVYHADTRPGNRSPDSNP